MASFAGGQVTLTTAGVPLPSVAATKEIFVQADFTNTSNVLIGGSATQDFKLQPGDALWIELSNLSALWAKSTVAGGKLNYIIVN